MDQGYPTNVSLHGSEAVPDVQGADGDGWENAVVLTRTRGGSDRWRLSGE